MICIERCASFPYKQKDLFDLINDIKAYPTFLPYCHSAQILEESKQRMLAKLSIGKTPVHYDITTLNTLDAPNHIHIKLQDGPLQSLEGNWHFKTNEKKQCEVIFSLRIELINRFIEMATKKTIASIIDEIMQAIIDHSINKLDNEQNSTITK